VKIDRLETWVLEAEGQAIEFGAGNYSTFKAMVVAITGYRPPLIIPWNFVAIGGGIIVGVSLLASLWPAAWVARAQPLDLLQAGRAAT